MKQKLTLKDGIFTIFTLVVMLLLNIWMQEIFDTKTLIPMLFVLGVFFVALKTHGYFWSFTASFLSVLLVNYTFTYPYYAFDLISPECVSSALVMMLVSTLTSTLTARVKQEQMVKAEGERERMRANLLRAVSHDLRTPLTTIYGSSSAIIENYDSLSKEQRLKLLGEMRQDSEWLIRMVENLLSVTRIDGGNVQLTKHPTVLEELIDAVLVKFHKYYPEQVIEVTIPEELVIIPMDAMLIEQVLINILENAIHHAKGMTKLSLDVTIKNNQAVFCISDDGCGIPEDRLNSVFSGYSGQETFPTDGSRNNMGIGLSVCSTIIKAHGSEIYVKNNTLGGASFIFALQLD